MMDHETRPRISLLNRLVKAVRPSHASATMGSSDMAEPAMHVPAMDDDKPGMIVDVPAMDAPAMDAPAMAEPAMAEPAMESSTVADPTDGPSMG